jgi:hypothetical protein
LTLTNDCLTEDLALRDLQMEELASSHQEALSQETAKVSDLEAKLQIFEETKKDIEISNVVRKS